MIFTALVPPWARELKDSSKPITEDDFVAYEEVNIDADMQARGLEDLQHIGDIVEAAAVVDENQFGRHLAEYNQKMQKGAVEFALLQPQGEVVLMRKCWRLHWRVQWLGCWKLLEQTGQEGMRQQQRWESQQHIP